MLSYIIRRILLLIPTLIGITAVTFFIMALSPGGFGGAALNQQGAQVGGQQAKEIREYFMRRYGLDQPVWVQYGRWLNDVSPIGFPVSANITFPEKKKDAVRDALATGKNAVPADLLDQAVTVTLDIAKYQDTDPATLAPKVKTALASPVKGLSALYQTVDAKVDAYTQNLIKSDAEVGMAVAQAALLNRAQFQAESRSRILFTLPIFKMPNLGKSLTGRNVTDLIAETLPITLLLNFISIPLIYIIAIITGLYAAKKRGQFFDVGSGVVLLGLWSVPVIWAGVLAIGYFGNAQHFNWFPFIGLHSLQAGSMTYLPNWTGGVGGGFHRGYLLDTLWHLVLPVICLSYTGFAVLAKITRGAVLENLTADFARTARAKGVMERDVLFRHVLRNSILPLITIISNILPAMLAGSVVVETIFSIHGMGRLMVNAAFMQDKELIMAITLIGGLLTLASWIIRDICYAVADPRVSYE